MRTNAQFGKLLKVWTAVVITTASVLYAEEKSGGFGIGPGMVLVENVRPGSETDVGASGFSFEVENNTDQKHTFAITTRTAKSSIGSWEKGYESIPDASWLRLDKNELELDAKTKGNVKLFITIPDKPEYYNRKFMGIVACAPGTAATSGSSVGLVVASRVQIETLPNDESDGASAGELALTPSSWLMSDARPGDSWRKTFKVRNNSKDEHTYTLKSINDVESDEGRHDRYFGQGFTKIEKESWADVKDKSFSIKPGETKSLVVGVKVSNGAVVNKRYEELLFLQDEKGQTSFIRLRTALAPATANADDGKKKTP